MSCCWQDFLDPLSPRVSIVHLSPDVFKDASRVVVYRF